MKRTDLAYVAGIVDGEGCISIAHNTRPGHKYPSFELRVTVTSTDLWLCQMLRMGFAGRIASKSLETSRRLPCWYWSIERAHAAEFLKLILPYLHIKKPQAELAIQFQEARGQHTTRYSEERRAVAEAEMLMLQAMKHNKTS